MNKQLLILSCFIFFFHSSAYTQKLKLLLDTFVEADIVQLDPLGNIYLLSQSDKTLRKYDPEFKILSSISFQNNWNTSRIDVRDPFKIILYYPGDFKIHILDAQLSLLQSIDAPELNEKAALGHYDSDRFILYDGNNLSVKNYKTDKTENSSFQGLHFNADKHLVTLKKMKNNIYVFLKKQGILCYTNQLFEQSNRIDPEMDMADLNDLFIFKIKNNTLFCNGLNNDAEIELYSATFPIKSLATTNRKLALLESNRLKLWLVE